MIDQLTDLVQRTRQHHGIEHATIHILTARHPGKRFSGLSDPLGFTILGDVGEPDLRRAVGDALLRLQAGEESSWPSTPTAAPIWRRPPFWSPLRPCWAPRASGTVWTSSHPP